MICNSTELLLFLANLSPFLKVQIPACSIVVLSSQAHWFWFEYLYVLSVFIQFVNKTLATVIKMFCYFQTSVCERISLQNFIFFSLRSIRDTSVSLNLHLTSILSCFDSASASIQHFSSIFLFLLSFPPLFYSTTSHNVKTCHRADFWHWPLTPFD